MVHVLVQPKRCIIPQSGMQHQYNTSFSRLAKVSKSLSRTLSLPRRCRICGKIVYFRSFRCRLCNYVSHRQCADHAQQWFNPNTENTESDVKPDAHFGWETFRNFGTKKAERSNVTSTCKSCATPHRDSSRCEITTDDNESLCRHQLHATETLTCSPIWKDASFLNSQGSDGGGEPDVVDADSISKLENIVRDTCTSPNSLVSAASIPSSPRSTTKSVGPSNGTGFYKRLVCWLTNRKLQQDSQNCCSSSSSSSGAGIKGRSISLKHPKEKYAFGDAESQMVRHRLTLLLSGVGQTSPTVSSVSPHQHSTYENNNASNVRYQQQAETSVIQQQLHNHHQHHHHQHHHSQHPSHLHMQQHPTQHLQQSHQCPYQPPVPPHHDVTANVFPCSGSAVFVHRDSGISSLSSSVAQTPSCGDCADSAMALLLSASSTFSTAPSSSSSAKNRHVQISTPSSSSSPMCFPVSCATTAIPSNTTLNNFIPMSTSLWQSGQRGGSSGLHLLRGRSHQTHPHSQHATFPYTGGHNNHHHHHHHQQHQHNVQRGGSGLGRKDGRSSTTGRSFFEHLDGGQFGKHCPPKTRTLSLESKNERRDNLCVTWPPVGRKLYNGNEDQEGSESGFEDYETDDNPNSGYMIQSPTNLKDTLGEWSIPFKDLKIGRQMRRGRHQDIYRGRWHGEVMIHIYHIKSEQETTQFWKEVTSLSMIRHENVALFMGVCIDMPQLAIITGVRKGCSLYEHIHINKDHFPLPVKVQIARQVAQAMSYLHAKGIVHRKLNSKNILLETKVKVCLLDQGMAQRDYDRDDYGCVPKGHLTYISPEIMTSLRVEPPRVTPSATSYTKGSDVFAFGTVLYELFAEQWPFQGQRAHSIIWQVATGHTQSLSTLKCSPGIKNLLTDCWNTDLSCRPNFHHILRVLQQNVLLQRRHSTSEPDSLNRLGFGKRSLLPC